MRYTYIAVLFVLLIGGVVFLKGDEKVNTETATVSTAENTNNNVVPTIAVGELNPSMPPLDKKVEPIIATENNFVQGGEVKEFIVTGKNFSFSPSTIKVKVGDRVKITFQNTQGFHDFVIDEFGKATKQGQAPFTEVLEFDASKKGNFEYYCSVGAHRSMGMKGILVVE